MSDILLELGGTPAGNNFYKLNFAFFSPKLFLLSIQKHSVSRDVAVTCLSAELSMESKLFSKLGGETQ